MEHNTTCDTNSGQAAQQVLPLSEGVEVGTPAYRRINLALFCASFVLYLFCYYQGSSIFQERWGGCSGCTSAGKGWQR